MSKYFHPWAGRPMVLSGVALVVLNYLLMMLSVMMGNWFGVISSGIGLVFAHIAFYCAVESEKSFYEFVNGKGE